MKMVWHKRGSATRPPPLRQSARLSCRPACLPTHLVPDSTFMEATGAGRYLNLLKMCLTRYALEDQQAYVPWDTTDQESSVA